MEKPACIIANVSLLNIQIVFHIIHIIYKRGNKLKNVKSRIAIGTSNTILMFGKELPQIQVNQINQSKELKTLYRNLEHVVS